MARRQAAATSWARLMVCRIVKEPRAPGGTRTLVAALRVRYPRRWTTSAFLSVGPEGLEPSPGGLRVRCAAANTLIPCVLSCTSRRGGNRTLDLTLIRGLLSPLSYAPSSGAEGTRTLTCRIKSPVCCRYTTTPNVGRAYAFQSRVRIIACSFVSCSSGSPESRTQHYAVISRVWATGPRLPLGWSRARPSRSRKQHCLLLPKHARYHLHLCPISCRQSERPDLNRRSPGPRPRDNQASLRSSSVQ